MTRLLKRPLTNAVCLGIFTAFYSLIFFITANSPAFKSKLYNANDNGDGSFLLHTWSTFLKAGGQRYIAIVLIIVSAIVIILLALRKRDYDEYHSGILMSCLAVALVLTLVAIGIFYLVILLYPDGIIEKFCLFITIHWTSIVLSDLIFVLLCRWR